MYNHDQTIKLTALELYHMYNNKKVKLKISTGFWLKLMYKKKEAGMSLGVRHRTMTEDLVKCLIKIMISRTDVRLFFSRGSHVSDCLSFEQRKLTLCEHSIVKWDSLSSIMKLGPGLRKTIHFCRVNRRQKMSYLFRRGCHYFLLLLLVNVVHSNCVYVVSLVSVLL